MAEIWQIVGMLPEGPEIWQIVGMLPEGPTSQLNGHSEFLRKNGTKDHVESGGKHKNTTIIMSRRIMYFELHVLPLEPKYDIVSSINSILMH